VQRYVEAVRGVVAEAADSELDEQRSRYLKEACMRQVRIARHRLDLDRRVALEILDTLFRLGTPPRPDGRYDGELVAMSTGLLSDPFFEWLTRLYLPWLGKTFNAAESTGDNVFVNNAMARAAEKLGWPEYRVASDDPPNTVRVFPFQTSVAPGVEDPGVSVLKIDYGDPRNPLPIRRITDEAVELPGGYILGKAHMRGLRELRRVAIFGLSK
jgi:hypothetical protein